MFNELRPCPNYGNNFFQGYFFTELNINFEQLDFRMSLSGLF
jgi:hypothetical protein